MMKVQNNKEDEGKDGSTPKTSLWKRIGTPKKAIKKGKDPQQKAFNKKERNL